MDELLSLYKNIIFYLTLPTFFKKWYSDHGSRETDQIIPAKSTLIQAPDSALMNADSIRNF